MQADERMPSAVQFLREPVAYHARLGVTVRRLLVNDGEAFRSKDFGAACRELGVRRRQINCSVERFIQSARRKRAYGFTYQHSAGRIRALDRRNHHESWHRRHQSIGGAVHRTHVEAQLVKKRQPRPESLTARSMYTTLVQNRGPPPPAL